MMIDLTTIIGSGLSLLGALLGALALLFRWFSARILADIDARLSRLDQIEERVNKLIIELPLHYQRKEDAIREQSTMLARMDIAWRRIEQTVHREDYIRDVSVLHAKIDALVARIDRILEER